VVDNRRWLIALRRGHNNPDGGGVYGPDVERDAEEFGQKNFQVLADIMSRLVRSIMRCNFVVRLFA